MCPVCIAAAAVLACKATTTGGVTLLAVKKFFHKSVAIQIPITNPPKEDRNG
jgi:hypothetical protein